MNYVAQTSGIVEVRPTSSMSQQVVESFSVQLERLHKLVNIAEERCHNILNLRQPTREMVNKSEAKMENDLSTSLANRIDEFSYLNNRMEDIVSHLEKIVG